MKNYLRSLMILAVLIGNTAIAQDPPAPVQHYDATISVLADQLIDPSITSNLRKSAPEMIIQAFNKANSTDLDHLHTGKDIPTAGELNTQIAILQRMINRHEKVQQVFTTVNARSGSVVKINDPLRHIETSGLTRAIFDKAVATMEKAAKPAAYREACELFRLVQKIEPYKGNLQSLIAKCEEAGLKYVLVDLQYPAASPSENIEAHKNIIREFFTSDPWTICHFTRALQKDYDMVISIALDNIALHSEKTTKNTIARTATDLKQENNENIGFTSVMTAVVQGRVSFTDPTLEINGNTRELTSKLSLKNHFEAGRHSAASHDTTLLKEEERASNETLLQLAGEKFIYEAIERSGASR